MAYEVEGDTLLDLSFLTEEEQDAIASVLSRDARLRQLEEGRVSKLRASLVDPGQLKTLTGDWFRDARSQRHRHARLGSDLVRASIRRKKRSRGEPELGSEGEPEEEEVGSSLRLCLEVPTPERVSEAEAPAPAPTEEEPGSQVQAVPGTDTSSGVEGWEEEKVVVEEEKEEKKKEEEARAREVQEAEPEPELGLGPEPEPQWKGKGKEKEEPNPPLVQPESDLQSLENGEEESLGSPGRGSAPPFNRMLSSSSSVSSLSSSTLSGSQLSLYSEGEAGAVPVRGSIQFSLLYQPVPGELRVQVIQCQGLAPARKRRSDPYVKSYLLPDKSPQSKRKTAVKKRNLNPVFNETLRYSVEQAELGSRVLHLSVWHHESLGRNLFLGEVEVPLGTWDWASESAWLPLQSRAPPSPDGLPSRGQLSLALKFIPAGAEGSGLPASGELHFWVKDAQNLIPFRSGPLDSYIQCSVLPDDSRASRQRTRVVRRSLSPVFNHTMVYDGFESADLHQACAELTLWDHGTLGSRLMGGTRLSLGTGSSYGLQVPWMDSTPEEQQLWQMLLARPCEWVDGLLPLRTNLAPRT
ncbi:synaptotagmin-like protein 1 isoform X2 [Dromiciops gliroides]|uniref:synaptotagmin-like protein 1 isoform X2 n=1 Tax=Dromiciops gliroides TaxID=33562 RepID=UPI001CC55FD4|nr:synaptotagmin-like protein 1 isoform X2 [Dromiciops gliroides]